MVMHGNYSTGLEFEFGDADGVFYEEDLLGASGESFEGAVFIPFVGGGAEVGVVQDLDGYVAERLVGLIAGDVGEGGGGEAGLSVLEFDGDGGLVLDGVDYFGWAQSDVDVVVPVPVHHGVGVGRDIDVEDADVFVFEREVMVGLGSDFDFGGCLRGEEGCREEEEEGSELHAANCSTG